MPRLPIAIATAIAITIIVTFLAAGCERAVDGSTDARSSSDSTGAPASRQILFEGVTYQSQRDGGTQLVIRSREMTWRKRKLGFFSVAFLWELVVADAEIRGELDRDSCVPGPTKGSCDLSEAWRDFVVELANFGDQASAVRFEPLLLEFMDGEKRMLRIRSEGGAMNRDSAMEFVDGVVLTMQGLTLEAERLSLLPSGSIVVDGRYSLREGGLDQGDESSQRGTGAAFRLVEDGGLRIQEVESAQRQLQTLESTDALGAEAG